jgi:hypothetical protein
MTGERSRPVSAQPWTDDPTLPNDGLDSGEENEVPPAGRHHERVDDPAHPDVFTPRHRDLPQAADLRGQPERDLVVDEHASQTAGAGSATQATIGKPAVPASADRDHADDPRHDRPDGQPG